MGAYRRAKRYKENTNGGIMLCGINHGDPKSKNKQSKSTISENETFISDARTRPYKFKNDLFNWFAIWGHPLATVPQKAGPYERAFFLSNWLGSKENRTNGETIQRCKKDPARFIETVREYRPKIILLTSVQLYDLFFDSKLKNDFFELLGALKGGKSEKHTPKGPQRYRAKVGRFMRDGNETIVIAMPHPAARSKGNPSKEYVREMGFKLKIPELLQEYKKNTLKI